MPLKAKTDDGQTIHVHIPQLLAWILGLCGTAIVAGVALLISLNVRVTTVEHTQRSITETLRSYVPRSEIEVRLDDNTRRLDEIRQDVAAIRDAVMDGGR